jgi:ATP-dependent helicase/nuclease subunit A
MPPAELIDDILRDTAYDFELRGGRATQARENVKKLRMLVRRLQNRGYLTMSRLAAFVERLSAGDESNAIVDAADAVNLMTVHAAKGLEFPVVFVVNLGRGTGGGDAIRLMPDDGTGAPAVSIAGFRSEADEREQEAEREESKRLLYVALTRARDRLYLAATVPDGGFRPGRGSLGEVLPGDFKRLLEDVRQAAEDAPDISWRPPGEGRREHRFLRVKIDHAPGAVEPPSVAASPGRDVVVVPGAGSVRPASPSVVDARDWAQQQARVSRTGRSDAGVEGREVVGRLVHRLFQARVPSDADASSVLEIASRLLRPDDELEAEAGEHARTAVAVFEELRRRPEVAGVLGSGLVLHEVPFTLALDEAGGPPTGDDAGGRERGALVRGTIDCLVFRDTGPVTVLEFKTGRPAAWHEAQLAIYVQAVERAWPGRPVEGRLVYAGRAD